MNSSKYDFQILFFESLPPVIAMLPIFQESAIGTDGSERKIFSDVANFTEAGLNAYFLKYLLTMKHAFENQILELKAMFIEGTVPSDSVNATLEFIGFSELNIALLDSKYIIDGDYGDDTTFNFLIKMSDTFAMIIEGGKE